MVLLPCAAIRLLRSARLHRSSGTPNIVLNRPSFATSGNSCFYRRDGEVYRWAASCGYSNQEHEWIKQSMPALPLAPGRGSCVGRTVLEGRPVQIADVLADSEYEFADVAKLGRFRTMLGVPLLREGVPIGVIVLQRAEVRPFTEKQIELATTFADQAVI